MDYCRFYVKVRSAFSIIFTCVDFKWNNNQVFSAVKAVNATNPKVFGLFVYCLYFCACYIIKM